MNIDSDASRLDNPAWKDEVHSQSRRNLERHIAHLHTLREVSHRLNSKLDLENALANILDEAIRATGAERGCLLLANAATGELETRLCRQLKPSDLACNSFRPSQTVIERVWSEGKPVLTANALEDPELAQADSVINYTLRSILCVPLHLQEQRTGVLYLDNRFKAGQFQEDDLTLILAIADQAAVALHNAQLYQQAVDRASALSRLLELVQALNHISSEAQGLMDLPQLLDVVGKRLEELGGYNAVLLLEPEKQLLEVAYVSPSLITLSQRHGQGYGTTPHPAIRVVPGTICHTVIQSREPCAVTQLSSIANEVLPGWTVEDATPGVVAPLIAKDEVIGLLLMGLPDMEEQGLTLMVAFANQIAGAIQSARLLREAETRLAERQSVLAVTRALVTEMSLPTLLEFIMVQAQYLANAEGAAVFLFSEDGNYLEQRIPSNSQPPVTGIRLPVKGSLAGMAVTTGHAQVSNDALTDLRTSALREGIKPANLYCLLQAPLSVRGKALGTLAVWNKRDDVFTLDDVRLIGLFADQAALAIHNAQILAHERELAALRERHRLARDIHDSVIQSLYSITLAARTAMLALEHTPREAQAPMEYVIELAQGAMAEMRSFIADLRPTYLTERGLVNALGDQAAALRQRYGLSVEFEADEEPSLSRQQKETLYLIAREALHNVVKHASAHWVKISLTTRDSQVILCVEDDGHGFDPEATADGATMGLTSMMERTALSGASLSLVSAPNQGVRLTVTIP
jgi:signal transduction histidine kinase